MRRKKEGRRRRRRRKVVVMVVKEDFRFQLNFGRRKKMMGKREREREGKKTKYGICEKEDWGLLFDDFA